MHWRRKEIISDLLAYKAISENTAHCVVGADYKLALKMTEDGQLGKVKVRDGIHEIGDLTGYNSKRCTLSLPNYHFYIVAENKKKEQNHDT